MSENVINLIKLGKEIFKPGGRINERPGTDHVVSGPMRGLKKTAPDGADTHIHGHANTMTESARWGLFSENT